MNRPSRWILLTTAMGVAIYVALRPPHDVPAPPVRDDGPVVVRRDSGAARADAERTVLLTGRVLDRLGWPVAKAAVRLGDGRRAATDERGAFRLTVPAFRRHRARITAPRYEPRSCWLHPEEDRVVVLEDDLPWTPDQGAPVTEDPGLLAGEGFLQDETGAGVAFGVVAVAETGVRTTADETGRYRIALPDGQATLVAWDGAGRVARGAPFDSVRKQGLVPLPELVLTPGLALRGYLKDSEGNPTAGAALTLRGQGVERQVITDDGGGFAFTGLLQGSYALTALPHRGSLGFRRPLSLAAEGLDLDLALNPVRPLTVRVVGDGRPVPGVWVLAEEDELRRAHGRTDAEGRARLAGLGGGTLAFEVREPERFESYEILDYDENSSELTVRLP